jgi:hypothetical protein
LITFKCDYFRFVFCIIHGGCTLDSSVHLDMVFLLIQFYLYRSKQRVLPALYIAPASRKYQTFPNQNGPTKQRNTLYCNFWPPYDSSPDADGRQRAHNLSVLALSNPNVFEVNGVDCSQVVRYKV